MSLANKIHRLFKKKYMSLLVIKHMSNEVRKMKNKRRQQIMSQVVLSDEQKKLIDDLFLSTYGKKVPYDWHRYYTSYTGNFDYRYIPELLFIPKIEVKLVSNEQQKIFADKNLLPLFVPSGMGCKTAKIYVSCQNGIYKDGFNKLIDYDKAVLLLENLGKAFLKPTVDSNSGKGCALVNFKNGVDLNSNKTAKEILNEAGNNFNVQEIIENQADIKVIHPESLNTFRIVTYVLDGKIYHFPIILRFGVGASNVDNAHQGGFFIGVNDDGTLNEKAFTEFQTVATSHPDTKIVFKNYKIQGVSKMIDAVYNLHALYPQVGLISWDVTLDKNGNVVIIEMNLKGQTIWMSQMAHGKGAFLDNTEKILKLIS